MKKLIVFRLKKKIYRELGKAVAAALLLGMTGPCMMQVSAAEVNQAVTYVYHQHAGSALSGGGCYQAPVYHSHAGNEALGGGCYGTAVYHVHTGDVISGGNCYGTAVLHEHTGDPDSGGGCFAAVPHKHNDSCYRTVSSEEYGCYTLKAEDTNDGDYEGHDFKYYYMSCGQTIYGTNPSHGHSILDCSQKTNDGYTLSCGKTEESIDSYLFDCEKTEGESIDSYELSCGKTLDSIDGYELSCGADEVTPIGKLTVTESGQSGKGEALMTVSFEDLSNGRLQPADDPFTWYNSSGSVIGTGDSITVSENGNYRVVLGVINEDVNRDSLQAKIRISSIAKPKEDNGSNGNGSDDEEGSHPQDNGNDTQDTDHDSDISPTAAPSPIPVPTPTVVPAAAGTDEENKQAETGSGKSRSKNTGEGKGKTEESNRSEAVTPTPGLKEKTETIKLPERKSKGREIAQIEVKEQKESFFAMPAVRLLTITAGTLLILIGLSALLYLLRMSVRIYNDNGNGGMIYLGRSRVKLSEDGYMIEISDAMEEKAVTNRYCIRPGMFRFFRGEDEELLVCRRQKRISVYLNKEMIVVI